MNNKIIQFRRKSFLINQLKYLTVFQRSHQISRESGQNKAVGKQIVAFSFVLEVDQVREQPNNFNLPRV